MPGGKCSKCGCTKFEMDFWQGCANVLTWGVSKADQIINNKEKDESVALKKCSCGLHLYFYFIAFILKKIHKNLFNI